MSGAGSRGGTFRTHQAVPIASKDGLGRTVMKCANCTRRVHERGGGRGRNPGVKTWVHTGKRSRGAAQPKREATP